MKKNCTFPDLHTRTALAVACLLCVSAAVSGRASAGSFTPPPFSHYQPILDKMPFGALPANFGQAPVDPTAAQTAAQVQAEQQKLAKQVNMSAVNVTPDGTTAIGFTDLSAKPPVNYYLNVGASADGWKVVSADYDDETATLEKDGVTITLQLGKGLVDPSAQPAKAGTPAALATAAAPRGLPAPIIPPRSGPPSRRLIFPQSGATAAVQAPVIPTAASSVGDIRSYKERLLERKTQQTEAERAEAKKQQDQLVKLAREAAVKEIARREAEAAQAALEAAPAMDQGQVVEPQQRESPQQQEGTVP